MSAHLAMPLRMELFVMMEIRVRTKHCVTEAVVLGPMFASVYTVKTVLNWMMRMLVMEG